MPRPALAVALAWTALSACGHAGGSASCGIESLTAPFAVKQAFAQGNALAATPDAMPASLPVRLVAGPVWPASVAADSITGWRVTTHGSVSKDAQVGYGVIVVDQGDHALGILAFNGRAIIGATHLGHLIIGDTIVPLLGVRVDSAVIKDPACPIFPDSVR